jgi:hypothetical protein
VNRPEVHNFLLSFFSSLAADSGGTDIKPFLDLVLSLKSDLPLSIPLLRDLAGTNFSQGGLLWGRIDRLYLRLCRAQAELGRLDLKKAGAVQTAEKPVNLEDIVFNSIDFSRYRKINEKEFHSFYIEGLGDFDEAFYKKNYGLAGAEIRSLILDSYKKTEGTHKLQRENSLVLSVMRGLEISLDSSPLFFAGEILAELQSLSDFARGNKNQPKGEGMEKLYPLLVRNLDNVLITHSDGMTTKLFITEEGDLAGTFRPGNKPWTRVLIPGR